MDDSLDDEFGSYNSSLTKEIKNTRWLEHTVTEIQRVVTKFTRGLEDKREDNKVSEDEVVKLRESIWTLCPIFGCELYLCYERIYQTYYTQTVLPCVKNKHGEQMLHELLHRWNNHKKMVSFLAKFFGQLAEELSSTSDEVPKSLHSHVISNRKRDGRYAATLEDLAIACFRDQLLLEIEATTSVMKMVTEEREGVKIDQALLKSVCDIYVQSGLGTLEIYERVFERSFLQDTESYYSGKASSWIIEDSFPDYLLKLEESLKKEKERVAHYLHSSTEPKLVMVMQNGFFVSVESELLEKEKSGCCSFLTNDKKDNLSRMFRVYCAFGQRLKPVADVLSVHITTKLNALTSGSVEEHLLVRELIGLHDKYMVYVNDCFQNHTLFQKVFQEAFVFFCNKKVGGSSIGERLGMFCDDLHKEAGDSKMDDLSKVYKLYHTISLPLDPVAMVFSYFVSTEVNALIQQADDAAATGSLDVQVLVKDILDLHVKHMYYVEVSFQNHSLFYNVLKDAFKIFQVATSSSALLLATYCDKLLEKAEEDDKMDDISTMFKLYHAISKGLEPVAKALRLQVTAQGNALIQQANEELMSGGRMKEQALVKEIICLHDKYMVYVTDWFNKLSTSLFHKVFKEAFEIFCNKTVGGSSFAELLATYCHNLLVKAGKDKSNDDSTIESTFDTVVALLRFITDTDRDLFAKRYRKKLGHRLLHHSSVSDEHERSILTKFKVIFGLGIPYKMEGMLKDMALAKEERKGFKE